MNMPKEVLIYSSPRRKAGSSSLFFLDSRVRGNDILVFNQRLPNPSFERDSQDAAHFGSVRFAPAAPQFRR